MLRGAGVVHAAVRSEDIRILDIVIRVANLPCDEVELVEGGLWMTPVSSDWRLGRCIMTHNDDVEAGGLGDGDVPLVIRFSARARRSRGSSRRVRTADVAVVIARL